MLRARDAKMWRSGVAEVYGEGDGGTEVVRCRIRIESVSVQTSRVVQRRNGKLPSTNMIFGEL
jgi:hypothetical protein